MNNVKLCIVKFFYMEIKKEGTKPFNKRLSCYRYDVIIRNNNVS